MTSKQLAAVIEDVLAENGIENDSAVQDLVDRIDFECSVIDEDEDEQDEE